MDQSSSPITPPHREEGMEAGSMLFCVRDRLTVLYCIGGVYTARARVAMRGSLSPPRRASSALAVTPSRPPRGSGDKSEIYECPLSVSDSVPQDLDLSGL